MLLTLHTILLNKILKIKIEIELVLKRSLNLYTLPNINRAKDWEGNFIANHFCLLLMSFTDIMVNKLLNRLQNPKKRIISSFYLRCV